MVARRKNGRNTDPPEGRRARVLGIFEETGGERLLGRGARLDGAGQEPDHSIDDDERGQLSAGQDVVADRELQVDERPDPFVTPSYLGQTKTR